MFPFWDTPGICINDFYLHPMAGTKLYILTQLKVAENTSIFLDSHVSKIKFKGSSELKMEEPTGRWEVQGRPSVSSIWIYQKPPENMISSGTTLEVCSSKSGASQGYLLVQLLLNIRQSPSQGNTFKKNKNQKE